MWSRGELLHRSSRGFILPRFKVGWCDNFYLFLISVGLKSIILCNFPPYSKNKPGRVSEGKYYSVRKHNFLLRYQRKAAHLGHFQVGVFPNLELPSQSILCKFCKGETHLRCENLIQAETWNSLILTLFFCTHSRCISIECLFLWLFRNLGGGMRTGVGNVRDYLS